MTAVAFVAVTVRLEEAPPAIEAGVAAILTVGTAGGADRSLGKLADLAPPHAVNISRKDSNNSVAKGGAIL
jgi:hypothetical protein